MRYYFMLECKKNKMIRYIGGTIGITLFCFLFMSMSMIDSATDPAQTKDTFETTFASLSFLISMLYLVFESMMMCNVILSEYNHKTILQLFTYPVSKKKLIGIKLFMVTGFMAVSMLATYFLCLLFLIVIDNRFDFLEDVFDHNVFHLFLRFVVSSTLGTLALSSLSFVFGMMKKSVALAMAASFFAWLLRQFLISSNGNNYYENAITIIVLFVICGGLTFFIFKRNVAQIENM